MSNFDDSISTGIWVLSYEIYC